MESERQLKNSLFIKQLPKHKTNTKEKKKTFETQKNTTKNSKTKNSEKFNNFNN